VPEYEAEAAMNDIDLRDLYDNWSDPDRRELDQEEEEEDREILEEDVREELDQEIEDPDFNAAREIDDDPELFEEANRAFQDEDLELRALKVPEGKVIKKQTFVLEVKSRCRKFCKGKGLKGGACTGWAFAGVCKKRSSCRCYSFVAIDPKEQ